MKRTVESPLLAAPHASELERLFTYASTHIPTTALGSSGRVVDYARLYAYWAVKSGLDPVLAICQSWHETARWSSWWFAAPRRNPAGIGVTGATTVMVPKGEENRWVLAKDGVKFARGRSFPDYTSACLTHVNYLAQYARGANPAPTAARLTLLGRSALQAPSKVVGSCTQWQHLGQSHNPSGSGWAFPGDRYGEMIAGLANTALG